MKDFFNLIRWKSVILCIIALFIVRDIISKYHGFLIEDAKPVLPILHLLFERLGQIEEQVFAERKKTGSMRKSRFQTRQSSPPVCTIHMILLKPHPPYYP